MHFFFLRDAAKTRLDAAKAAEMTATALTLCALPSQGRLLGRGETCRVDLAALREAVQGAAGSADTSDESADLTAFLPKLTERAVRWAAAMVLSRAFYFDVRCPFGHRPTYCPAASWRCAGDSGCLKLPQPAACICGKVGTNTRLDDGGALLSASECRTNALQETDDWGDAPAETADVRAEPDLHRASPLPHASAMYSSAAPRGGSGADAGLLSFRSLGRSRLCRGRIRSTTAVRLAPTCVLCSARLPRP